MVSVNEATLNPDALALAQLACATNPEELDFLLRSIDSDEKAWSEIFGVSVDKSGLAAERNVFRYLPSEVVIRASGFVSVRDIVRTYLAGSKAGATLRLSVSEALPQEVVALMHKAPGFLQPLSGYAIESEREFVSRISTNLPGRIRLLGSRADAVQVALDGAPEVAIYASEVTESGRVEMVPYLKEQAISITAHRFGAPDPRFIELPV
jgi:RHH-type proline utilization regulon transcriptional repressor/proline dehydrogenase/delta 1-pyrroline-5-carboxylate dehydrogenase